MLFTAVEPTRSALYCCMYDTFTAKKRAAYFNTSMVLDINTGIDTSIMLKNVFVELGSVCAGQVWYHAYGTAAFGSPQQQ